MRTRGAALSLVLLTACIETGDAPPPLEDEGGEDVPLDAVSPDGGEEAHAVGAPCLPEQVPEAGFDDREAYLETSSLDCETRVCLVFHLSGDPRESCQPVDASGCDPDLEPECAPPVLCADPSEVTDRVYCSCRCDAGDTGFAECDCPSGFSCIDVLEVGGPSVRGGYCVRDGTFAE